MSECFTPGPWRWAEQEFQNRYAVRMRNGNWRAKPGHKIRDTWVMLLVGPPLPGVETVPVEQRDELDYKRVIGLRWSDLRGSSWGGGPTKANMRLIAKAPELLQACENLIAAVEKMGEPAEDTRLGEALSQARATIDEARGKG